MPGRVNSFLEKNLPFIITIGGITFLGLSGLNKFFNVKVNPANSKRLFIAGISLLIIGIPIYYLGQNKDSSKLDIDLIKVEFFEVILLLRPAEILPGGCQGCLYRMGTAMEMEMASIERHSDRETRELCLYRASTTFEPSLVVELVLYKT